MFTNNLYLVRELVNGALGRLIVKMHKLEGGQIGSQPAF